MNQAFKNLPKDEQKRILDAAFIEFTDTKYELASTNEIVGRANISKGRLFYYFSSKQKLFEYLVETALDYVKKDYLEKSETTEKDFIKRFVMQSEIKKQAFEEEPHLYRFLSYVFLHETTRMPVNLYQEMKAYMDEVNANLYKNIDRSVFREDIDSDTVMTLLRYALEGYQEDLLKRFKHIDIKSEDLSKYYDDFYAFLATLKKIYYK